MVGIDHLHRLPTAGGGCQRGEEIEVALLVGSGLFLTECRFPQQIEGKGQALAPQLANCRQGLGWSCAGDEALSHAAGVTPHR